MNGIRFIAEIGSNHNQDIGRTRELIKTAHELGFWGVKFQLFKSDFLYANGKNKEILKDRELPMYFISLISSYCQELGLKFGITPFYNEAVDETEKYVDFYKISSFDIMRHSLIFSCLQKKKPVFISLGLAEDDDIMRIIDLYEQSKTPEELYLMHCVSKYPTSPAESCVNRIKDLNEILYNESVDNVKFEDKDGNELNIGVADYLKYSLINVGYSDHTVSKEVIGQAINNGADLIEIHFDLNDMEGKESEYGHVWSEDQCLELFEYINTLEEINNSEFELKKADFKMRADSLDGMRR